MPPSCPLPRMPNLFKVETLPKGQLAMPWADPSVAFRYSDVLQSYGAVMDRDMLVLIQYFRAGITGSGRAARQDTRKEARRAWRSQ